MVGALKPAGAQGGSCVTWSVRTSAADGHRRSTPNVRHDCEATNRVRVNLKMPF